MFNRKKWFDRTFASGLPLEMLPVVIERLRGGPAAVEDRVSNLPSSVLIFRDGDRWSIQENIGHLLDVEPLWLGRVDDFVNGTEALRAADLTNTKTREANHNVDEVGNIIGRFRLERAQFVEKIESLSDEILGRTALHPRLKTPMNIVDLGYFVAEHDIHHLAAITDLISKLARGIEE